MIYLMPSVFTNQRLKSDVRDDDNVLLKGDEIDR